MGRPATGQFIEYECADGSRSFSARVSAYGNRYPLDLGDEHSGVTSVQAKAELARVVKEIGLGIWRPPEDSETDGDADLPEPAMASAASEWLSMKRAKQLRDTTIEYLEWAVNGHLVPHFGALRPSEIDLAAVKGYTQAQIARREEIRTLRERGLKLEGPRGGAMRPMSAGSINSTLDVLTQFLMWGSARRLHRLGGGPSTGPMAHRCRGAPGQHGARRLLGLPGRKAPSGASRRDDGPGRAMARRGERA